MKEKNIQSEIMLALSYAGSTVFRNNCGVTPPQQDGRRIRYGVGNPGGSDLIGITPVTITPDMVGQTLGVFTAIEVKKPTGSRISQDQKNFIAAIINAGGYAGVARSPEEALEIIKK